MPEDKETYETPVTPAPKPQRVDMQVFATPFAIIIAGIMVSLSILFDDNLGAPRATTQNDTQVANERNVEQETSERDVAPVSSDDHILGNPNAEIVIVEYSDFDCPFCKNFHDTMNQIIDDYGETGKVAWVYRHFPIEQLHPNADTIAEASECVADIGGNAAFWKFTNFVFGERETNEPTDISKLASYAARAGVNSAAYTNCMDEGRFSEKIQGDVQAAVKAGARGTPYSVVLVDGEQVGIINGAQQYNTVKLQIENTLTELK